MNCATGTYFPDFVSLTCDGDNARFLPSPDDIAAECLAIQAGWPEEERLRRERGDLGGMHGKPSKMKQLTSV